MTNKIEKLTKYPDYCCGQKVNITPSDLEVMNKINELIDVINSLDAEGSLLCQIKKRISILEEETETNNEIFSNHEARIDAVAASYNRLSLKIHEYLINSPLVNNAIAKKQENDESVLDQIKAAIEVFESNPRHYSEFNGKRAANGGYWVFGAQELIGKIKVIIEEANDDK